MRLLSLLRVGELIGSRRCGLWLGGGWEPAAHIWNVDVGGGERKGERLSDMLHADMLATRPGERFPVEGREELGVNGSNIFRSRNRYEECPPVRCGHATVSTSDGTRSVRTPRVMSAARGSAARLGWAGLGCPYGVSRQRHRQAEARRGEALGATRRRNHRGLSRRFLCTRSNKRSRRQDSVLFACEGPRTPKINQAPPPYLVDTSFAM